MGAEHLGEVDQELRVRGDVVAVDHGCDGFPGERDRLLRPPATREHACAGDHRRWITAQVPCLLQLDGSVLVPPLGQEHAGELRAVERDVSRRAHLRRDLDRVAQLPLGGFGIPGEHLHLSSGAVRLREPIRDPQLAADRLRALEPVACLVEAPEARVEVRAPEQSVRLDRGQAALLRPGELLVEEREHLVDGSPAEEHRPADFVPRLDLSAEVAGCERVLTAPLERHELRSAVACREFGQTHDLPGIRQVGIASAALEHRDRPSREVA